MTDGVRLEKAQAAKKKAQRVFGKLLGDVAVGVMPVAEGSFGIKVNVESQPDETVSLPKEVDGVPVRVEVVGTIRKRK